MVTRVEYGSISTVHKICPVTMMEVQPTSVSFVQKHQSIRHGLENTDLCKRKETVKQLDVDSMQFQWHSEHINASLFHALHLLNIRSELNGRKLTTHRSYIWLMLLINYPAAMAFESRQDLLLKPFESRRPIFCAQREKFSPWSDYIPKGLIGLTSSFGHLFKYK